MAQYLSIQAPRQGIAPSPHIGYGMVSCLNVTDVPGVAQLNFKFNKKSSTTVTENVNWFQRYTTSTAQIYAYGNTGKIYASEDSGDSWAVISGNTTSNNHGNGLLIWKDYLFAARDTSIDVFGPLAGKAFTVTIASPAVFSCTAHGLTTNDTVRFKTTDALPTGLAVDTTYYIIAAGLTADAFEVSTSQGGSAVNTSGSQSGTHTLRGWDLGWQTIDSDVLWHPMLQSKNDGKLYGGAGKYVYSIDEVTGQTFKPGDTTTFTFTKQALDLPANYRIKCMEELGNNLMLGTWQGTNINDLRVADIFSWDRSSVSFGQPIIMGDYGVHAMVNNGNYLIVLAGISGKIYRCDGANTVLVGQLPIDLTTSAATEKYQEWYPGSICVFKNRVYFGTGNGGTTAIDGQGVYSINLTGQGSVLVLEHINSQATTGSAASVKYTALLPLTQGNMLMASQTNDTTYGIDKSLHYSYAYATTYSGFFETPLYVIGPPPGKRSFVEMSFQLAKEMAADDGLRIKYRLNLTDSWTTIGTYTYSDLGAITSYTDTNIKINYNDMIQFRVEFDGTATSPQLKTIIFA